MKSVKSLVDEYADITRQIKALEPKQASLAEQIKVKGAGRQDGTTVAPSSYICCRSQDCQLVLCLR